MIKTAVIGASGYIGSYLFRAYREVFPDCVGTSFSNNANDLTFFDLRTPDLDGLKLNESGHEAAIIASAMPNVNWCESHPKESYELNVQGTLQLVKQLERKSLTTIFLSSDYVFNGDKGSYSDTAETHPITEYGRQKAEVEREIPNLTNNYMILRLSKIYGLEWKDGTLIDSLAADFRQNKKIMAATDQFFNPTFVNDVVSLVIFAQHHKARGLFNLCNNNKSSRYDIANKLAVSLNVHSSLLQAAPLHSITGMEKRPLNTSLECSTLFKQLQLSLLSIEDAIQHVSTNWSGV